MDANLPAGRGNGKETLRSPARPLWPLRIASGNFFVKKESTCLAPLGLNRCNPRKKRKINTVLSHFLLKRQKV